MAAESDAGPQPQTVQVGTRTVHVDAAPLSGWPSPDRRLFRLRDDDRRYVLGPRKLHLFLIGALLGLPAVATVIVAYISADWRWLGFTVGLIVAAGGALALWLPPRVVVDFENRRLILSRGGLLRRTWPLELVAAVQICCGGTHRIGVVRGRRPEWPMPWERGHAVRQPDGSIVWTAFQLNLVLDDERRPRLNIAHHGDHVWIRTIGTELAARLKVPLVDQMQPF
jgi:hypothetical protein